MFCKILGNFQSFQRIVPLPVLLRSLYVRRRFGHGALRYDAFVSTSRPEIDDRESYYCLIISSVGLSVLVYPLVLDRDDFSVLFFQSVGHPP